MHGAPSPITPPCASTEGDAGSRHLFGSNDLCRPLNVSQYQCNQSQETVCIDESGQWLTAWNERHLSMGTKLLRTTINHTPHKSPTALSSFAKRESRLKVRCARMETRQHLMKPCHIMHILLRNVLGTQELYHGEGAASSFPSLQLFEHFCKKGIIENALPHLRGLVKRRVVSVEPHSLPAEDGIEAYTGKITWSKTCKTRCLGEQTP